MDALRYLWVSDLQYMSTVNANLDGEQWGCGPVVFKGAHPLTEASQSIGAVPGLNNCTLLLETAVVQFLLDQRYRAERHVPNFDTQTYAIPVTVYFRVENNVYVILEWRKPAAVDGTRTTVDFIRRARKWNSVADGVTTGSEFDELVPSRTSILYDQTLNEIAYLNAKQAK
ncbi:hypothetical protein Trydic_g3945 [Trypoxylus dichotomus]